MHLRSRLFTALAAAALLVAACETDDTEPDAPVDGVEEDDAADDETTDDDGASDETDESDDDAGTDEAIADGPLLEVGTSDLGDVLVDHEGLTVYVYVPDEAEDGQPTCTGSCASVWAPVATPASDPEVGEGVDDALVGTVEREDAAVIGVTHQLTYDGRALYTFASDDEPGQLRGHELAELWSAVAPDGEPYADLSGDDGGNDGDDTDDTDDG